MVFYSLQLFSVQIFLIFVFGLTEQFSHFHTHTHSRIIFRRTRVKYGDTIISFCCFVQNVSLVNFCDILLIIKYLMSSRVILLLHGFSGFLCVCGGMFLFVFQSKYFTCLFNKVLLFMNFLSFFFSLLLSILCLYFYCLCVCVFLYGIFILYTLRFMLLFFPRKTISLMNRKTF